MSLLKEGANATLKDKVPVDVWGVQSNIQGIDFSMGRFLLWVYVSPPLFHSLPLAVSPSLSPSLLPSLYFQNCLTAMDVAAAKGVSESRLPIYHRYGECDRVCQLLQMYMQRSTYTQRQHVRMTNSCMHHSTSTPWHLIQDDGGTDLQSFQNRPPTDLSATKESSTIPPEYQDSPTRYQDTPTRYQNTTNEERIPQVSQVPIFNTMHSQEYTITDATPFCDGLYCGFHMLNEWKALKCKPQHIFHLSYAHVIWRLHLHHTSTSKWLCTLPEVL